MTQAQRSINNAITATLTAPQKGQVLVLRSATPIDLIIASALAEVTAK